MTTLARLIDSANVRLPGALRSQIENELFDVIEEFCRLTLARRRTIDVTLAAGQKSYAVSITDTRLLMALTAEHDTFATTGFYFENGEVTFLAEPTEEDEATPVVVTFATVPVNPAADADTWLTTAEYAEFYQTLFDGICWRMMSQAAKPYSSERLALWHAKRFRNGASITRSNISRATALNASAWAFPSFA